ncbi:hypothetical protein [Streptomyces sp. NPDC056069]|uniref:hypothetical protein n=1 Tax=Streptomyces sp. NPDC056069 TaxID=3345702 RepID=UPI0035D813A2
MPSNTRAVRVAGSSTTVARLAQRRPEDASSIHPVLDTLTVRVAERELGLPAGSLRPER